MSYYRIHGKYHLACEGNHRSVIAKHLFAKLKIKPYLYGVDVIDYELDMRRLHYFQALKKLLKRCYGGRWKAYACSNADSMQYQHGDECRYRIVILEKWDHVFHFNSAKTKYVAHSDENLKGFIFDNDNIDILYQFLNTKLGKGKTTSNIFSPVFVLEAILSGELSQNSSYGYQIRYNWYEDTAIRSQIRSLTLDSGSYLYLYGQLPIYSLFEQVYLAFKYKMYRKPIVALKQLLEYRGEINHIRNHLLRAGNKVGAY